MAGVLQLIITLFHIGRTTEHQLGQDFSAGQFNAAVFLTHHVQDDVGVCRVGGVSVAHPVRRLLMYLYVTHPEGTANFQLGIEEVGACIPVGQTGVNDFHRLAVGGKKRSKGEKAVVPDVVKKEFHVYQW